MQHDILKFLMDANTHFNEMRGKGDRAPPNRVEDVADLQAVERALPDCDWFELTERQTQAVRDRDELPLFQSASLVF